MRLVTELLFDNLNVLKTDLTDAYNTYGSLKNIPVKLDDIVLDYLIYAYAMGVEDVNETFGANAEVQVDKLEASVFKKIADKDFRQRVNEYVESGGTVEDILRIAETDTTRIYNEAGLDTAERVGAKYKTWCTMLDDRVREQHSELEGIKVGVKDRFYSADGDSALSPGGFTLPENNVNCRCWLTFS